MIREAIKFEENKPLLILVAELLKEQKNTKERLGHLESLHLLAKERLERLEIQQARTGIEISEMKNALKKIGHTFANINLMKQRN